MSSIYKYNTYNVCMEYKHKLKEWIDTKYNGSYRFVKLNNTKNLIGEKGIQEIFNATNNIDDTDPFSRRVFWYINDITNYPLCFCGKYIKRFTSNSEYSKNCSNECKHKNEKTKQTRRKTNIHKYGNTNVLNSKHGKEKAKQTCLQKYGTEHHTQAEYFKENAKKRTITEESKYKQKQTSKQTFYNRLINSEKFNATPLFTIDEYQGAANYTYQYKWRCHKCDTIYESWINNGIIKKCPKCYSHTNIEQAIIDFLNKNNIEHTTRNRNILANNRELDIYRPSKKIAIETNGIWYHSEAYIDSEYHLDKTNECNELGIQLIHIFEDEINYKLDIVKSRLGSILGLHTNKIPARKCEIKEILKETANTFYINNHLQGKRSSSHNLGLYYNNELVMCMSFSLLSKITGHVRIKPDVYEITRIASQLNTTIIGGAHRLFNYFINRYSPKFILSYCDLRWSKGNVYTKIGMSFVRNTQPGYWYITPDRTKRLHRFHFRKSMLSKVLENYDENLTEKENMRNHNYVRVYDCGNAVFEWTALKT